MKKLSKKHIIIIISVAITIIALALVGVLYGIHNGKDKETVKENDKIESVEDNKTDEDKEEKDTEKDTTSVVEDESEENTSQSEEQTPEVEEPKQETTQQQGSSNTNNNNNNNNSGGGTTTPSTPATTPTPTPEPEKSPYAGMYRQRDTASKERLAKCVEILKGGIASQYIPIKQMENSVSYWEDEILVSASVSNGAWMYVNIAGWSGQGIGTETEPIYAEIPSLTKRCIEAIAPQGGTELYNKINSLILQYGDEHNVPSQGTVSESIPGLSVTINDGVNGLEIFFWAE